MCLRASTKTNKQTEATPTATQSTKGNGTMEAQKAMKTIQGGGLFERFWMQRGASMTKGKPTTKGSSQQSTRAMATWKLQKL